MNGALFLGFFMNDDNVIDESFGGHEIFIEKTEEGLYREILTGLEFKKGKFEGNEGLTVLLCQRIDPNVRYKEINRYRYFYDKESINYLIKRIKALTLTKHK